SLDAAPIVSGVLHVSAVQAERRVREAVRRAADGPEGTVTCTGLGGLHAAMAAGRLDAYRAGVVAYELEEVPADVARAVIAALEPHLDRDDATRLRRRVRRVLARISPDLLREKSVRARSASSLRRWVDEPGLDTWLGTFPSEEACTAWAAIDALAQQYVTDGTCDRIDRARAKALTDLVTGHATIDLQVQLLSTTPAAAAPADRATPGTDRHTAPGHLPSAGAAGGLTGADREGLPASGAESVRADRPTDLVAVHGLAPGEPVLVPRDWLSRAVASTTSRTDRYGRVVLHPDSGALTDPDENLATDAYRPGAALARLVRARDGHCRFPGCHVAARFCDLDHVTPWPSGPTTAANLACLCRRH
ncbi:MAG: HNH endonuclease, partial [Micrococcales bacterium]|nr:HNH endonuclease [Micrococcales bacterium]